MRSLVAATTIIMGSQLLSMSHACDCAGKTTQAKAKELSISDVEARRSGGAVVIDANSEERFVEGHVPGARWIPFDGVTKNKLPSDKTATLIFYCYNERCGASTSAANAAIALGFENVFVMPAGIKGWEEAGKPIEKGASKT